MIAYLVPSRIPSLSANSMQVMKMADALLAIDPQLLMVATRGDVREDDLHRLYGIDRRPHMVRLPLAGRAGPHLFGLGAALLARWHGADLVLTRSVAAAAFAARLGLATVFECHAPPLGGERLYWRWLAGAPAFRRLVVISDALRRIMADSYPETSAMDVVVAHDGVDLARFQGLPDPVAAKRAAGRDVGRKVAGYAGHLYAGRGIELILDLAAARPEWDFILLGGTPKDVDAWRGEAAGRHLGNVDFGGFVANADLASRLAVCDVLLMPYQRTVMVSGGSLDTARWMSPLKMFEYLAMGRAIVVSDLPVLREVFDGSTGILVPPDDLRAWTGALDTLADEQVRQRLSAEARRAALDHDWCHRVRLILHSLADVDADTNSR